MTRSPNDQPRSSQRGVGGLGSARAIASGLAWLTFWFALLVVAGLLLIGALE